MNDLTYTDAEIGDLEPKFAAHLHGLGGWRMDTPHLYEYEKRIVGRMIGDGRLERATKDRFNVLQFTDAGWAWCRENGIGS